MFLEAISRAIDRVSQSPGRWPRHLYDTRRYVLHKFPYSIIYIEILGGVKVIAIAHASRRPGYWKSRI